MTRRASDPTPSGPSDWTHPAPSSGELPATLDARFEALADRLRAVRHQLTRGRPLADVLSHEHLSPAALRAVERLESAVRWVHDGALGASDGAGLPWLVHVIEKRATELEAILRAEIDSGPSPRDSFRDDARH